MRSERKDEERRREGDSRGALRCVYLCHPSDPSLTNQTLDSMYGERSRDKERKQILHLLARAHFPYNPPISLLIRTVCIAGTTARVWEYRHLALNRTNAVVIASVLWPLSSVDGISL